MIGQSQEAEDLDWLAKYKQGLVNRKKLRILIGHLCLYILYQFLTVQYKKLKILSVQLNIVGQSKGTEAGSDWSLVNNKWCWILIG